MNWFWRRQIKKELGLWVEHVLSRPSSFFNGLPPCPYARRSWAGKTKVVFGVPSDVDQIMRNWSPKYELVILVVKDQDHFPMIDCACKAANVVHQGSNLYAMDFVPDAGPDSGQPDEEMVDWPHVVDEPYAMIFVQELAQLKQASKSLRSKGYYKNCTDSFNKYVLERNNHARQEEGDEEGGNEERHEEEGCQQEDACRAC